MFAEPIDRRALIGLLRLMKAERLDVRRAVPTAPVQSDGVVGAGVRFGYTQFVSHGIRQHGALLEVGQQFTLHVVASDLTVFGQILARSIGIGQT